MSGLTRRRRVLPLPNVLSKTSLTFLTLDVLSNQPNNPTFVNLDFCNESLATPWRAPTRLSST